MSRYSDGGENQITGDVSSERLCQDKAGRVAIPTNKGKAERKPHASLVNVRRHNSPLPLARPSNSNAFLVLGMRQ